MSKFLEIADRQLREIEKKTKEKPPGDEQARCLWICTRIREMIIAAQVREELGKSITVNERNIEETFKMI